MSVNAAVTMAEQSSASKDNKDAEHSEQEDVCVLTMLVLYHSFGKF